MNNEEIIIKPSHNKIAVSELIRIMYEEYPEQVIKGLERAVTKPRKTSPREALVKELRSKGLTIREIIRSALYKCRSTLLE